MDKRKRDEPGNEQFVRRVGSRYRGIVKNLNESKKSLDPSNNFEEGINFVTSLPNSLKFGDDTKYEFMFNILDTVHDVFEGDRADRELFSMFGVGESATKMKLRHGLTELVFGLGKILLDDKNSTFKYLLKNNTWNQSFQAKGFRSFWLQYLGLENKKILGGQNSLGLDLSDVKTKLIANIKKLAATRSYTFHSQLVKNVTTSEYTMQEIRGGNVMNDIFTKFDRYYAAVDATKTKFFTSTKLILTPAMLLDSANTPKGKFGYTMLFVDCEIIKEKDYIIVKFNTTSQQMTCKFHVTMFIFPSAGVLYEEISKRSKTNNNRQTFLVQGVTMKLIHQSTVLVVNPDYATKNYGFNKPQTRPQTSNSRSDYAQFLDVSIVLYHITLKTWTKELLEEEFKRNIPSFMNPSCTIIWQRDYTGISMNNCTLEIVNWKHKHIGRHHLSVQTRGLQNMMIQFFLDFKRMGDAYQITYLKAYNKIMAKNYNINKKNSSMPFIFFTTQDILAVCQAIGISDSQDVYNGGVQVKSGDATTGLPFVFNTTSQWMMGTNVNHKEHTIYHANQVAKQKENSEKETQKESNNIQRLTYNRKNFVEETLKLASKVKHLNFYSTAKYKNEHEMVFKHFQMLSQLTPENRELALKTWAKHNAVGHPSRRRT
tara:strand:- start:4637 stop:6598 length:1962 start_codon:yes stop_codon:yes gene_type:complete